MLSLSLWRKSQITCGLSVRVLYFYSTSIRSVLLLSPHSLIKRMWLLSITTVFDCCLSGAEHHFTLIEEKSIQQDLDQARDTTAKSRTGTLIFAPNDFCSLLLCNISINQIHQAQSITNKHPIIYTLKVMAICNRWPNLKAIGFSQLFWGFFCPVHMGIYSYRSHFYLHPLNCSRMQVTERLAFWCERTLKLHIHALYATPWGEMTL